MAIKKKGIENSLAVQWLGVRASAGGMGSVPGQEQRSQKLPLDLKKKKKKRERQRKGIII